MRLREDTSHENFEEATSGCVLGCEHRVEAQKGQRSALNNIKKAKDFDAI